MDNKALLLSLVKAESEEEVQTIINHHPLLSKDENWKPYDDRHGNFNVIHNQAGHPIPSLVEKPINSIDALLMKECLLRGVDPKSEQAPKSIKEAVEKFFGIKGNDFTEATETERRKIAENIQIIAEGSKKNPNIIIYDSGEGQHPDNFKDTFVSLTRENKLTIKFVQGQYGMGGSGALPYCGENKYQLILSRKHPKLLNGKKDLYGFTLVREHQVTATGTYKNSWYEYCIDRDGKVFTFSTGEELDLGLYKRKFDYGTYIKLFNYDLPDPSIITLDLWRDLNRYLYSPALPILLYEKRDYKGHQPTKIMMGNRMRIMIDDRKAKETTFPMSINFGGMNYPAEVTIFKDNPDNKREFIDNLAVIFTVSGQVHEHLTNNFITASAKLPYLSGYLLANIDCTNLSPHMRNKLFMTSRDRMRDNTIVRTLREEIAKELRDNDILRQLNERRMNEKLYQNPKDEEFLKKVMSKLIQKNEELSKLLGLNGTIVSSITKTIKGANGKEGETFRPKRFPTFVRFKKIAPGNIKMLPQNGECKLLLETDVEDEYQIRPQDKGELKIIFEKPHLGTGNVGIGGKKSADEEIFDVNVVGPNQGQIKIRIKTKEELPVGTEVPVNIELTSPEGPHILKAIVKIVNPIEKAKEKEQQTPVTYRLPKTIQVYKEKKQGIDCPVWDEPYYRWNGQDICKILPSSDQKYSVEAVAINMDADVLHNYIRSKKLTDKNIEHVKRQYEFGIYLISLIVYFQLSRREDIEEKEELLSYLMKGVGKIIIQVVINEEIIKEYEKE